MISCVLLTGGESQRFGSPKALANIHSHKAIHLLLQTLIASVIDEIIVVTGAHESLIKPYVLNHSKVRLVHNKDWKFGQTSSFQTGIASVEPEAQGILLLPIDCPFIRTETINLIVREFQEEQHEILVPTYHQKRGHPPVFHAKLRDEIAKLPSDIGLNTLMADHDVQTLEVTDPGTILSFNTQQELEAILRLI